MPRTPANLVGRKFGRWTVLKQADYMFRPNGERLIAWTCVCDCGVVRDVRGANLRPKLSSSCGCFMKEQIGKLNRVPIEESFWNMLIARYKTAANDRNYDWQLTKEEFKVLATLDCAYCGAPPIKNERSKRHYLRSCQNQNVPPDLAFAESKIVFTNGIDRINNTDGYHANNVVACCKVCNRAKSDMTIEEWENWLIRVTSFRNKE